MNWKNNIEWTERIKCVKKSIYIDGIDSKILIQKVMDPNNADIDNRIKSYKKNKKSKKKKKVITRYIFVTSYLWYILSFLCYVFLYV